MQGPVAVSSKLKQRHISMIALGGAIGGGLFVGSSSAIAEAGPGAIVAFLVTGLFVMAVMTMLGRMVVAFPNQGSFVSYIRLGHGPCAGYLAGWLYWFFWVVAIGSEAIAGAVILHGWIPLPIWCLAVGIVMGLLLINIGAVHVFGETEFWLSLVKVLAIIFFIGLCSVFLVWNHGFSLHANPALRENMQVFPKGFVVILGIIPTALFTMLGAELGTVAAGDSASPQQTIARVTYSVGLRICSFYLCSLLLILLVTPWRDVMPGHSPFLTTLARIGVPHTVMIMQCVVLVAVLSCLNSSIYITSRILAEMARSGDAPQLFRSTDDTPPRKAVIASCLCGVVVAFSSILSPGGVFSFLLNCSGAVVLVVYVMISTAHYTLFRAKAGRQALGHVLRTALVIAFSAVTFLAMFIRPDQRATVVSCFITILFFLAIYAIRKQLSCRRAHVQLRS
ncbi:amino acid/polyamine transporter [Komagataeibacter sucrofermentans DSM 15973]|nr:amino acid/polyamine transporter [Komagataeibacter sucrofermentans DSM 15973]